MADPVVVRSSIKSVSVFRSGAVVTRVAPLPGGTPDEVAIDGLPLALEDDSVRVRVRVDGGSARPTDVRINLVVPPLGESLTPPSQKEIQEASDVVESLSSRIARIQQEITFLDRVGFQLPAVFQNRPPRPAPAAAWSGMLDWTGRLKKVRLEERTKLEEEMRRASEDLARLQRREEEASAHRDAGSEKVRKRLVVRLRDGAASGELVLEYRVPGATWRPTYALRMARDGRSAQLSVRALVVQDSGEPWERVKMSLSTADLLARADLPELKSLRIGRRQEEPAKKAWRPPPGGLETLFEGLDRALSSEPEGGLGGEEVGEADDVSVERRPRQRPASGARVGSATIHAPQGMPRNAPADRGRADEREMKKDLAPLAQPAKPMPAAKSAPAPIVTRSAAPGAAPSMPPPPPSAPMGAAMALGGMADMSRARGGSAAMAREEMSLDEGGGMDRLMAEPEAPADAPFGGAPGGLAPGGALLRYADLVMASWSDDEYPRGKLRSITLADRLRGLSEDAAPTVESLIDEATSRASGVAYAVDFPSATCAVEDSVGSYDYKYDAEGPVDVPSDGKLHSVPLFARRAPVTTTLIVVPRESTQAVRVAAMKNPLEAPLLQGPAEIFLEDEFLVESPIRTVPAGAELKVGLGVEEALKVARNAHFDEEKAGLLGGSATLSHKIDIEIASRMSVPVKVEVRERIPIKDDETSKDIEIVVPDATPPWEDFDQADTGKIKGGKRWRFSLGAGESKKLAWSYVVKIDAKNEVVGGNRRE